MGFPSRIFIAFPKCSYVYVGHVSEVEEEDVDPSMARDAKIQWLINEEKGAINYALRRFRILPGGEIRRHQHPWEHEIYVLSGKGVIGCCDGEVEVTEGNFLFIPPDKPHWYRNPSTEDFVFLCIIPIKK